MCLAGSYALPDGTGCDMCGSGSFCVQGLQTPCPAGTFQSQIGQTGCNDCGVGRYNDVTGRNSTCNLIAPGFFSPVLNDTRATNVSACSPGSYCVGGIRTLCGPGSVQVLAGQANCTPCVNGTYSALAGTSAPCTPAPPGYYVAGTAAGAASTVLPCVPGFACIAGVATACAPMTYAASAGLSACAPCAPCAATMPSNVSCDPVLGITRCVGECGPCLLLFLDVKLLLDMFGRQNVIYISRPRTTECDTVGQRVGQCLGRRRVPGSRRDCG